MWCLKETLPLLLNAVNEGKLTYDIKTRLYTNPQNIFNIPEQPDTYVEVEIDRKVIMAQKEGERPSFLIARKLHVQEYAGPWE
ncbi:putative bifunctional pyrimidine biosynthesis protein [Gigaspora margarita]|uniref:Putative bifunctional pyrimidine biosynthesis protein n=1 Tax=Gigaspora margarita TaxID=4874 RepID=A0A8H4AJ29_GIGMA|nr:putative bifunctional pyrimidine biosynthesis protein [Gigaspora margarita]